MIDMLVNNCIKMKLAEKKKKVLSEGMLEFD